MTILQTATTSFKVELLQAVHSFGPTSPDTFKIALYTAAASLGATTTVYTTTNEVSSVGTNYTAGGNTLVINPSPTSGNNSSNTPTAFISFNTTTWTNVTFTCRGALIYNSTQGGRAVAVLSFGSTITVTGGDFNIIFPTAAAGTAILQIA